MFRRTFAVTAAVLAAASLSPSTVLAVEASCATIMDLINNGNNGGLQGALIDALGSPINVPASNTGLELAQWAAVVDRDGNVCSVVFSGVDRQSQWPASRAISMQKANTANSLSLDGLALSTANLWAATQPGGSLFGLQFSNPVDTGAAYKGPATNFGTDTKDPAVGGPVGGINVFGGGLALYSEDGVIGGLGTSGNTSCADHIIGWKTRDALGLDFVPDAGGVSPTNDDNIIFDIVNAKPSNTGGPSTVSAGGFGHPLCGFGDEENVAASLPVNYPIGSNNP